MRLAVILILIVMPVLSSKASEIRFPGQDIGIEPHKALYEVSLQSARSGTQIVDIAGQMYYEWGFECDAWTSKHRFNVLYEYADSPAMRISSDFSNFETFDGKTLNYSVFRYQNGQQYEEIRGHATTSDEGKGTATYNEPKGLVQELPEGTLFPLTHTLKVIEAIKRGEKFFNATIFDGSDADGPVEINAFMGQTVSDEELLEKANETPVLDENLLNGEAQHVQLAFFPLHKAEDQADYEMRMTLHHNSVISDMVIDYGDFSIRQKLIALEPVDATQALQSCQ